jgi:hypothetical protein
MIDHYISEIDRFINEIYKKEAEDTDKDYQNF